MSGNFPTKVTKEAPMERYSLSNEHCMWATIALRDWTRESGDGRVSYCGEIMIHSDYGDYAYSWGSMGHPLKEFLTSINRGYVLNKLSGGETERFDFDRTIEGVKKSVIEERRKRWFDKDEAREIWDEIPTEDLGKDMFVHEMMSCRSEFLNQEPWHHIETSEIPQLAGMWDYLWVPFVEHLRTEITQETKEAA
ncbi:hypothetical protein [Caballeronia cordobensis]|uniref:hypothetical protein n=1 Tax=Caballeronia cordobensis TaxID=1353886 RepID=UPI00045EE5B5|nr:putative membrane protein [Burkholderia sp. RPE67]